MTVASDSEDEDDRPRGVLLQAVTQLRSQSPEADVREAALARLARRLDDVSGERRRRRIGPRARVVLSAVAACAATLLVFLFARPPQPSSEESGFQRVAPRAAVHAPPPWRADMAGVSPSRHLAISSGSRVLVATGNDDVPIALGDARPFDGSLHVLHVWDWSKGKESRALKLSHAGALAVSPDGKTIVTNDGRAIDIARGEARPLDNFNGKVRALKFSPDGKALVLQIAAGENAAIHRLLEFPSGKLLYDIPDTWTHTFAAAFTPDGGQVVLMGIDRVVRRFDAKTGKEVAKYPPAHSNSVRAVAISDDGKLLATCASSVGEVRVFDLGTAKLLRQYTVRQKPDNDRPGSVYSLAFSHDGKMLAGGGLNNLLLWDVASGDVLHIYPGASRGAIDVRFAADDKSVTAVTDFTGLNRNGVDLLAYPDVQAYAVQRGN